MTGTVNFRDGGLEVDIPVTGYCLIDILSGMPVVTAISGSGSAYYREYPLSSRFEVLNQIGIY
jgi:hypothetical protein